MTTNPTLVGALLAAASLLWSILLIIKFGPCLTDIWRRSTGFGRWLFAFGALAATLYGGTKNPNLETQRARTRGLRLRRPDGLGSGGTGLDTTQQPYRGASRPRQVAAGLETPRPRRAAVRSATSGPSAGATWIPPGTPSASPAAAGANSTKARQSTPNTSASSSFSNEKNGQTSFLK